VSVCVCMCMCVCARAYLRRPSFTLIADKRRSERVEISRQINGNWNAGKQKFFLGGGTWQAELCTYNMAKGKRNDEHKQRDNQHLINVLQRLSMLYILYAHKIWKYHLLIIVLKKKMKKKKCSPGPATFSPIIIISLRKGTPSICDHALCV
jgi:hypothetical protein